MYIFDKVKYFYLTFSQILSDKIGLELTEPNQLAGLHKSYEM